MLPHRLTFGWFLKFAIIIFCTTFLVTVGLIRAAHATDGDYGPIPGPAGADCEHEDFWVDPDVAANVTAVVTLDGTVYPPLTVPYDGNVTHRANFPWTPEQQAALNEPGPHDWTIVATWDIGTGSSTFTGTVTCAEPPETTTTTVPVTAPPASSPPAPHVTAVPPSVAAPHSSGGTGLPNTGSDALPLTFLGGLCLSAGVVAVRYGRRFGRG